VRADTACPGMDELLAERASGVLPPEDCPRLDAHLPGCERCRAELARYEDTFGLVREGPRSSSLTGGGPDLASSTLRLWNRHRRRRVVGVAVGSGVLAAAAAASLALAPGLLGKSAPQPMKEDAQLASWEPDVDGALEASGLSRELDQDEEMTTVDVVLTAFDAAEQRY
jgi:anti-sigma factor RsiW